MVQLQKYPNTFLLVVCFPTNCSKCCCIDTFFEHLPHVENTFKCINTYACPLLVYIKGKLVLFFDQTVVFHKKRDQSSLTLTFLLPLSLQVFCIKEVHLSDQLSLTCPRIWPIEDICIGLYVLKCLLNVQHIFEKVVSMQCSFEEFLEKNKEGLN